METIDKIKDYLRSGLSRLQQSKGEGRKIIGYTPGGYFPEELALAAEAVPVCMMRGGDRSAVEASMSVNNRWMDTFYRAQIGNAISGKDPYYNIIDILFAPITDCNNRAFYDALSYHTNISLFPFGIPHAKTDSGLHYYLHGLTRVKEKVEQFTGIEITEKLLKEAIDLCNRERELLRQISLMRKSDPAPIRSKDFVMINHASMFIDKGILMEILQLLMGELGTSDSVNIGRPRILLTGSTLAMGDYKVLDLIEEAGGDVVMEEFDEGVKPYWQSVRVTGDPMKALADAYFTDRVSPSWFRPAGERLKHLVQLAKDYEVRGVIWYQLMYRESYKIDSYYFPEMLKSETGISMLTLESDYDPAETGQMRTRIETYVENIRS